MDEGSTTRTAVEVVATLLCLAAILLPTAAFAFRGGSSEYGDSYLNDAVRNPRFIEPGAENDPARYRASNPFEGYDDRQAAAAARRGRVNVEPYRAYRP